MCVRSGALNGSDTGIVRVAPEPLRTRTHDERDHCDHAEASAARGRATVEDASRVTLCVEVEPWMEAVRFYPVLGSGARTRAATDSGQG